MKLDRNLNADGRGKYGLILNRELATLDKTCSNPVKGEILAAIETLERHGIIDWGTTLDTKFFVIRLRDKLAAPALRSYAIAAFDHDPEYAEDVFLLANTSGIYHPNAKTPD